VAQHEIQFTVGVDAVDTIGAFEMPRVVPVLLERCVDGAIGRAVGAPPILAHHALAPVGRVVALVAELPVRLPRGIVGRALLEERGGARVVNVLHVAAQVECYSNH